MIIAADDDRLEAVLGTLQRLPPLVFAEECDQLRERLAAVARGEAFLLQGGYCAETVARMTASTIEGKLRTLLQMAVILTYGASMPVVKVGHLEATSATRTPDPARMLEAYYRSSASLNFCRAFIQSAGTDLRQLHDWNQEFVARSPVRQRYEQLAGEIDRAIAFMQACATDRGPFRTVELYSGHEALLLDYEQALTRIDPRTGRSYDLSAHLLCIGAGADDPDGAYVRFARDLRNPLAVKIGPGTTSSDVLALTDALNPGREPGRLTMITRMGAARIRDVLPPLVEKVEASGTPVAWVCDPMHGNRAVAASGRTTCHFDDMLHEITGFFEVHRALGTHPGGIHIEFTGDDLTGRIGGGHLDLAFLVADRHRRHRFVTPRDA